VNVLKEYTKYLITVYDVDVDGLTLQEVFPEWYKSRFGEPPESDLTIEQYDQVTELLDTADIDYVVEVSWPDD
jgi:hypothetical protein